LILVFHLPFRRYEKSVTNTYLERSFGAAKVPVADGKPLDSGIPIVTVTYAIALALHMLMFTVI
jgi:hypothetical protein